MKTIPVQTLYLQMHRPPDGHVPPPMDGVDVVRIERPPVDVYRSLYDLVGRDWNWINRKLMPDDELAAIIHHELVDFDLLYVAGTAAGICETDRRVAGDVELVYFGLAPPFIGKGLGKYFLNRMLHEAWAHGPRRVWLHTCELDHEAALPNYQQAGLVIYDERIVQQKILDEPL
jgi:GNAT superfamily N-acetyltransferase